MNYGGESWQNCLNMNTSVFINLNAILMKLGGKTLTYTCGPERMERLWSLISRISSIKRNWFLFYYVENLFSTKWHRDHSFWVRRLDPSAILVRQCHFQNLVLFGPHRTLEHNKILTSRPPVSLTEHLLWKRWQCEQTELSIMQQLILRDVVKGNILAVPRTARIEKVANLENDIASLK